MPLAAQAGNNRACVRAHPGCPPRCREHHGSPRPRPEIVQHHRNGLLCRSADPVDLAQKIETLLDHPQTAAQLGRQAAIDCEARYNPRQIAGQSLEFYTEVRERWGGTRARHEGFVAPAVSEVVG